MATDHIEVVGTTRRSAPLHQEESRRRVSWGAIFGGAVVALGIWALLYSLGLALGLSSIDPGDSIRGPAVFTGIWSVLAPLVALFVGGYVAARLAGLMDRTAGALHGAVVWGFTTLVGAFALTMLITTLVGTAVSAGQSAVSGAASAAQAGGAQLQQAVDVSANEMLAPINERLRAQGKPELTAQGLSAAMQSAVTMSLREGRLDAQLFETALAQNTNLSRQDVKELAGNAQGQLSQVATDVQNAAASAASSVGSAFWGVFFALLLGLVSSVLGSIAGAAALKKHDRKAATTGTLATERRTEIPHTP